MYILIFRDAQGLTPFMLAVTVRAYPAALILLDTIHRVVTKVVVPPIVCEMQGTSTTEQEHAIKNVMNAWRSSVAAGTGSSSNSNKVTPEISTQSTPPMFKNPPINNFDLPHPWSLPTSGLPQQQQSNDFSKGSCFFFISNLNCNNINIFWYIKCFIYIN